MVDLLIEDVDEQLFADLTGRAAQNGCSIEDEARHLLHQSFVWDDAAEESEQSEHQGTAGKVDAKTP